MEIEIKIREDYYLEVEPRVIVYQGEEGSLDSAVFFIY